MELEHGLAASGGASGILKHKRRKQELCHEF
jgi:hypothetical protein